MSVNRIIKREMSISIHDYDKNKLCDIYNSHSMTEGQAYNVFIRKESSGWKELSFELPLHTLVDGEMQDNHRISYIKNEYLVRVFENNAYDWYLLSEPTTSHKGKNISLSIVCGHVSSLLRTKKLYLELDDTNGIGTAQQIAHTILDGTGWTVGPSDRFFEKDGTTEKIRSLSSGNKIGAYQLILNLCKLFNAKPIFNGDDKTVEIRIYNPFHNPLNPSVPIIDNAEKVFELNYGKTLGSVTRVKDTASLITKLNVEGSYGDEGYVGIEDVHPENLNYLVDFSYFEKMGMFTPAHQSILDTYLIESGIEKGHVRASAVAFLEKETVLNDLWGGSKYGVYNITQKVSNTELMIDPIFVTDEEPVIKNGDQVVLLHTNGTHIYGKIKANAGSTLSKVIIEGAQATAGYTKLVLFFTPSLGKLGGKESALFAAEDMRTNKYDELEIADPGYGRLHISPTMPSSNVTNGNLWVKTGTDPALVYKRQNGNWNTEVKGRAAIYARSIADSDKRIQSLLVGTTEDPGLYNMMAQACALAEEISILHSQYYNNTAILKQLDREFANNMGDMLRDGYWNDSNYTVGQEQQLYDDALEVITIMAQPDIRYTIDPIDIFGQEDEAYSIDIGHPISEISPNLTLDGLDITVPETVDGVSFPTPISEADGGLEVAQGGEYIGATFYLQSGYLFVDFAGTIDSVRTYRAPSWKDIDTDFCVHIIDDEINISAWGFVETVNKCYDQPWRTDIVVNTKQSDVTGKSFTDILASIAEVAEEVRGKADVYDRSRVISSAKQLSTAALQGVIDADQLTIMSNMSNWATDSKGNIVFTSHDGTSAMMLTGRGFMIANKKTLDGDWEWRTFGTGDGFTADVMNAGVLNAGQVQILGTDQFYWDADNIYIYDTVQPLRQIRIGRYNGVDYGIGYTQDGGATWQTAIGFDGVNFTAIHGRLEDIEGRVSEAEANQVLLPEQISLAVNSERIYKAPTVAALISQLAENNVPIKIGLLWLDTTVNLVKRCQSVAPLTWAAVQADEVHTSYIDIFHNLIKIFSTGKLQMHTGGDIEMLSGSKIRMFAEALMEIQSGGMLNFLAGSELKMQSGGLIKLLAGSILEMYANSKIEINSGGLLHLQSGATMTMESGGVLEMLSGSLMNLYANSKMMIRSGGVMELLSGSVFRLISGSGPTAISVDNSRADGAFIMLGGDTPESAPFVAYNDGTIKNVGNSYTQVISENADSTHGVVMDVFFPSDVSLVDKVLLSVKMHAFRAYSTGAKISDSLTSQDGGGGERTSRDSGAVTQTLSISSHYTDTNEDQHHIIQGDTYNNTMEETDDSAGFSTKLSVPGVTGGIFMATPTSKQLATTYTSETGQTATQTREGLSTGETAAGVSGAVNIGAAMSGYPNTNTSGTGGAVSTADKAGFSTEGTAAGATGGMVGVSSTGTTGTAITGAGGVVYTTYTSGGAPQNAARSTVETGGPTATKSAGTGATGGSGTAVGGPSSPATGTSSATSSGSTGVSVSGVTGYKTADGSHNHAVGTLAGGKHTHAIGHTHTVDAHSHAMTAHTHTGPSHTHSIDQHSHYIPAHGHGAPADHRHIGGEHSHSLGNHSHSMGAHTHASPAKHSHLIPSHSHVGGEHTHSLASHQHAMGAHTHASAAPHTHLMAKHSHYIDGHRHTVGDHTHNIETHTHWMQDHSHVVPAHKHGMNHEHTFFYSLDVPGHQHLMNHSHNLKISAHSHKIDIPAHSHTILGHKHDIEYGIYEGGAPSNVSVYVDGVLKLYSRASVVNEDIASFFSRTGGKITRNTFHTVEIVPNTLGRISAHLYIKTTQVSKVAGTL